MRKGRIKEVAVLFSSGLDSTYLVWDNLRKGNIVTPYYVDILNNKNKSLVEKQNIGNLWFEFQKEFGDKIRRPVIVSSMDINLMSNLRFKQIPIWILNLLFVNDESDEIQIGYVAKDDAISHLDDIKKSYKSFDWLFNGKRPKLVFPLLKKWKEEIIDEIPLKYREHISSCENPNVLHKQLLSKEEKNRFFNENDINEKVFYEPCGKCDACNRILNTNGLMNDSKIYKSYSSARRIMYNTLKREFEYATEYLRFKNDAYSSDVQENVGHE